MKMHKTLIPLALLLASARPVCAHNVNAGWRGSAYGPLSSDDPNYFVIADSLDKDTLNDDPHIEFYLSLGYPVHFPDSWWVLKIDRVIPVYNGLYDFYVGSSRYDSSPIISRRQNPGLVVEWDFEARKPADTTVRFGYFHESNGQTLDDSAGTGAAEFNVLETRVDEEYALSHVSRGWDYLMTRVQYQSSTNATSFRAYAELRHHFDFQAFGNADSEEDIFWEPVPTEPGIHEYDGLRLLAEQKFKLCGIDSNIRLELKTGYAGDEALQNWTYKPSFTWGILHLFYFDGYGKEPSSYHIRNQYAGIGVEFR